MRRLFILAYLLLSLALPSYALAADELHSIKKNAPTNMMYERAVQFFTVKIPEAFEMRLNESQKYIDVIRRIFTDRDIPLDLAWLPLIESGFSPLAVGPGDTVGLWQLVKGTARKYGLRIDHYVDERKDPVKSTYAAANYFRDLYQMFGAWDIALAAYNAGEGKIRSLFTTYGKMHLPAITNLYLAKFMAASTVAQNPETYGFNVSREEINNGWKYDEVITDKVISLRTIALMYNTTVNVIKELNPALLTETTPPYEYLIRLPIK
jgi:membrane-bound lytic murein transglycosylase D